MPLAVIFDVDGTLVDSNDLHAQAWQRAFRESGLSVPYRRIRPQIGKGGDQLLPALLSPEDYDKHHKQVSAFRDKLFKKEYLHLVKPFPAVRELFERCRARGLKVVLGSSGKDEEVTRHAKAAGITGLYEAHTTSDDASKSKPHPDIFASALKDLGSPRPRDVVVVGDTPYDAEAAGKLGVRTVGLLCGGFPEADLRAAGCVAVYRDPADLLAHFDASPLAQGRLPEPGRANVLGNAAYWFAVAGAAGYLAWSLLPQTPGERPA